MVDFGLGFYVRIWYVGNEGLVFGGLGEMYLEIFVFWIICVRLYGSIEWRVLQVREGDVGNEF